MPLDPATIPPQPPSVDDATSLAELLRDDLARFALGFDGHAHFGEHWLETLGARTEEWREHGTLPRDLVAVRALLSLTFREERFLELDGTHSVIDADGTVDHEPYEHAITDARREHERFKHALLARIRELASAPVQTEPVLAD